MTRFLLIFCLSLGSFSLSAQQLAAPTADSLQARLQQVELRLDLVQDNLIQSQKRFRTGMIVASIGYTVTIAGGQMLGGRNADLGEALLYVGGGTGIAGTFLLLDAFKFLKKAGHKPIQPAPKL